MPKMNHGNFGKRISGYFPGTTLVGSECFVMAFEAIESLLPPKEIGSQHFYRHHGDFVYVKKTVGDIFVGHWVQGMTVLPGNNGPKRFLRSKTRPLTISEIERLIEILQVVDLPSKLDFIFASLESESLRQSEVDGHSD